MMRPPAPIHGDDRVSRVLARDESLIDVLVSLSPAFERLRNPALRRVMTRLVTVRQAARMGGVAEEMLLARLNEHIGAVGGAGREGEHVSSSGSDLGPRPVELGALPPDRVVRIDVRDELRAGREPFTLIMDAVRRMPAGGALAVRAIFEPVPLYEVMRRRGLSHWTERHAADDWTVWFYPALLREPAAGAADAGAADSGGESDVTEPHAGSGGLSPLDDDALPADPGAAGDVVVLDVRGLEPPEPMARTLAALEQLGPGATLVQLNVRVPQFLLPLLEERGFSYEIIEQEEDLVRLFIRRSPAPAEDT
jgi:uncharacterized protein (DUF2249 family)